MNKVTETLDSMDLLQDANFFLKFRFSVEKWENEPQAKPLLETIDKFNKLIKALDNA